MKEEEKAVQVTEEDQNQQGVARKKLLLRHRLMLAMMCAIAMAASASAESPTGMAAVAAQASTATTWISNVFDMITGNAYLATLMAFGLLAAAIRIFRKAKRAAR